MPLSSRMPLYTRRGGPAHIRKDQKDAWSSATLCGARGMGIEHAHPVLITCRRCLKLMEINAGTRKGRAFKKTGQKFRQQLLLGGERRNGSTFAETSAEHRRELEEHARSYATAWLADPSLRPPSATVREWREVCEDELARRSPRTNPVTSRGPAFFDEPGFHPSSPVGLTQRALHKAIERIDRAPDHAALSDAHRAALDLYRKRGGRALGRDAGTLFNDINFSYTARYRELGPTEEDLHTERMRVARAAEKAERTGRRARRNPPKSVHVPTVLVKPWGDEPASRRELGSYVGQHTYRTKSEGEQAVTSLRHDMEADADYYKLALDERPITQSERLHFVRESANAAQSRGKFAVWVKHPGSDYEVEARFNTQGKAEVYAEQYRKHYPGIHVWVQATRSNPKRNGSPRNVVHGLERARYIQQDAHEALLSAAAKRDMRGVQKYADQIARAQDAEQELERAMSYVGKAQRKRHITGSWRTEDRLKDVGLAEWRQKLAGQSVGRALAKLRPNGRGHDPAAREQAIGQLRDLGMTRDEAVANLDGAVADGSSYGAVVRWARRHYSAARDNAMGGAFGPAD